MAVPLRPQQSKWCKRRRTIAKVCGAALVFSAAACDGEVTKLIGKHVEDGGDAGAANRNPDEPGCGQPADPGVQSYSLVVAGDERTYHVAVPETYDPERAYPVVFAFHSRDETGLEKREYLGLERVSPNDWALFVYPDALVRRWKEDDTGAGWQNGPATVTYGGTDDLDFVDEMITELSGNYCIDEEALFATGHGWGGDFVSVLGCYAADTFVAVAPVAANTPYFLPNDPDDPPCNGQAAVWLFHGKDDGYYPLEYGLQNRDFWLGEHDCDAQGTPLSLAGLAADDDCFEYDCAGAATRFCSYTASVGHQIPANYYAPGVIAFFRGLL